MHHPKATARHRSPVPLRLLATRVVVSQHNQRGRQLGEKRLQLKFLVAERATHNALGCGIHRYRHTLAARRTRGYSHNSLRLPNLGHPLPRSAATRSAGVTSLRSTQPVGTPHLAPTLSWVDFPTPIHREHDHPSQWSCVWPGQDFAPLAFGSFHSLPGAGHLCLERCRPLRGPCTVSRHGYRSRSYRGVSFACRCSTSGLWPSGLPVTRSTSC